MKFGSRLEIVYGNKFWTMKMLPFNVKMCFQVGYIAANCKAIFHKKTHLVARSLLLPFNKGQDEDDSYDDLDSSSPTHSPKNLVKKYKKSLKMEAKVRAIEEGQHNKDSTSVENILT